MDSINLDEGVIWGHRLLLRREPENAAAVADILEVVSTPEELRTLILGLPGIWRSV